LWTFAVFSAKNFEFFEIYDVFAWTRGEGVEPMQAFSGQGEVAIFFVILCRRPL